MTDNKHQMFTERYQSNDMPWDTGITPPEIVDIIGELPAGKALDLGCGTGTNIQYLLERGWQADGVDFIQQAIDLAQDKLADFPSDDYRVFCYDVTKLDMLEGLRPPYDLVIDIGCGHGIEKDQNQKYADDVARLLKPGGVFMLYASQPRENSTVGWTPDDIKQIFTPALTLVSQDLGDDTSIGVPSGWYRFVKKS